MTLARASFAAGCFWGVEARFRAIPGVVYAAVGYMGGVTANPSYREVCSGSTQHAETVQLEYDERVVSYEQLLDRFFAMHNPTTRDRQGPDWGSQYRSVVFWHTPEQRDAALVKLAAVDASGRWPDPAVTEVVPATMFWRAEEYHQRYLEKHRGAGGWHP